MEDKAMHSDETVVLIHGLGGTRLDMWPVSRRLKNYGFQVENWGYRSLGNSIEKHAERLVETLSALDTAGSPFHLVTHSMGGIIARTAFAQRQFRNIRRIVMLAPPHHGSHAARKLTPWMGWLSPSLEQLSDSPGSFVNRLSNPFTSQDLELGIIEASKDRVIEQGKVLLDGYQDFAKVDGHHGVLTWYPQTIGLIESFLTSGRFDSANVDQHVMGNQVCDPAGQTRSTMEQLELEGSR